MKPGPAARLAFAAVIAVLVLWSLAPFLWQFVTSMKSPHELAASPPAYWPARPSLASYGRIFEARPFGTYLANSVIVALGSTLLCIALAAPAAYAFARLEPPGARWVVQAVLLASLFPPTMLIVALYKMAQALKLLNHPLALILPYAALNLPFAVWTLMSFFKQMPKEVEEAAWIDGLSRFETLLRIVLPMAAPAAATTAILVFIFSWNEFLLAMTLMMRDSARTVPVGIAMLSGVTVYEVPWDQISAAVVLTTLPVVAAVLAFQRRIVEGLTGGAVKG